MYRCWEVVTSYSIMNTVHADREHIEPDVVSILCYAIPIHPVPTSYVGETKLVALVQNYETHEIACMTRVCE